MKKMILSALLAMSCIAAQAQHLEVGAHGGYGTTWLLNNNVSDQGDNLDYVTSFGPLFGIGGGYFFESRFGVVLALDYASVNQKYTGKYALGTIDASDKLGYFEIPILIRKYSKGGFYFEVGPKFSFLMQAKESIEGNPSLFDTSGLDVKDGYKKTIISAAFGIGGHFPLGNHFYADASLRFAYGFTDATVKFSQTELAQKESDSKISVGDSYAHQNQTGAYAYKATHLATGHVLVGVSYEIPATKKSKTGKAK